MKIKLINPNTTASLGEELKKLAQQHVREGTEILAVSSSMGPASIESYYDEYLAIPGVFAEIEKGEQEQVDAYVIACFGDPGLLGAREITDKPVIGIAEAAMIMASMLAPTFSLLISLPRSRHSFEHVIQQYGMQHRCRSIRATSLSVLDIHEGEATLTRLQEACRQAVEEDHAEAILLGCAAMSTYREALQASLGVPVIDGTLAAVKFCEALVDLGATTSKLLTFSPPEKKHYSGLLQQFERKG